jgi:hypothetical protein
MVETFDGALCNDNSRVCGPTPPNAPANLACFSGTGVWNASSGKADIPVAFRVEVEDHGEPGTSDEYRIWIYIPQGAETPKDLAAGICCESAPTTGTAAATFNVGRTADIFDGATLTGGNIQIHPEIAAHSPPIGGCPVPDGQCPASSSSP